MKALPVAAGLWGLLLLVACSSSGGDAGVAPAATIAVAVEAAMPVRRQFEHRVEAFGSVGGDNRNTQTLSLPQAGSVIAADITAGTRVRKGQVLLRLGTDPAARDGYRQARTALDLARGEWVRTRRLSDEHLATTTQLASARKALDDAEATLRALAELGAAQDTSNVVAPADGIVVAVAVTPGDRVAAGTKLIEFFPHSALVAELGVEPGQAARIRNGMAADIALVYDPNAPALHGTVTRVADAVDAQTHLVTVLVAFDDGDTRRLAAGSALSAQIRTGQFSAWAVPRAALLGDDRGSYLYQIRHGKAHRVDVQVLSPAGDSVGVEGALEADDPVITLGAWELGEGDAVRTQAGGTAQ